MYSWLFDNGTHQRDLYVGNGTLTLAGVSRHSTGLYTCAASSGSGRGQASAVVKVLEPPMLTSRFSAHVKAPVGTSMEWAAEVQGYPQPNLTWWYEDIGTPVPSGVAQLAHRLAISNISVQHQGTYILLASNVLGSATIEVYLNVQVRPTVLVHPRVLRVSDYTRIAPYARIATCLSPGDQSGSLQWTWDRDPELAAHQQPWSEGQLLFVPFAQPTPKVYTCSLLSSSGGTSEAGPQGSVTVVREDQVSVYVHPQHLVAQPGQFAVIHCVSSDPQAALIWSYEPRSTDQSADLPEQVEVMWNGKVLRLLNVVADHVGRYVCSVANARHSANTAMVADVTLAGAPVPPLVDKLSSQYSAHATSLSFPMPWLLSAEDASSSDAPHLRLAYRQANTQATQAWMWLPERISPSEQRTATISDLRPNTPYEVFWQARSSAGPSLPSAIITARTAEHPDGPIWPLPSTFPSLCTATAVTIAAPLLNPEEDERTQSTAEMIRFSYLVVDYSKGMPSGHSWVVVPADSVQMQMLMTPARQQVVHIQGLTPRTRYKIRACRVRSDQSCSSWSAPVSLTTADQGVLRWPHPALVDGGTTPTTALFNVPEPVNDTSAVTLSHLSLAYQSYQLSTGDWSPVVHSGVRVPLPVRPGATVRLGGLKPATLHRVYAYGVVLTNGSRTPFNCPVTTMTAAVDSPFWPGPQLSVISVSARSATFLHPRVVSNSSPVGFSLHLRRRRQHHHHQPTVDAALDESEPEWLPWPYVFTSASHEHLLINKLHPDTTYNVMVVRGGKKSRYQNGHTLTFRTPFPDNDTSEQFLVTVIDHKTTSTSVTVLIRARLEASALGHLPGTGITQGRSSAGPGIAAETEQTIEGLQANTLYTLRFQSETAVAAHAARLLEQPPDDMASVHVKTIRIGSPVWPEDFLDVLKVYSRELRLPLPAVKGQRSHATYSLYMRRYNIMELSWTDWSAYAPAADLGDEFRLVSVIGLSPDTLYQVFWLDGRGVGSLARSPVLSLRTLRTDRQCWPDWALAPSNFTSTSVLLYLPPLDIQDWNAADAVLRHRHRNANGSWSPWVAVGNLSGPQFQLSGLSANRTTQVQLINQGHTWRPLVSDVLTFKTLESGAPVWPVGYSVTNGHTTLAFRPPAPSNDTNTTLTVALLEISDRHKDEVVHQVPFSQVVEISHLPVGYRKRYRIRVRYPGTPFTSPITLSTEQTAFTTRLEAQVYSVSLGPRSVTLTLPWRLSTDILNRTAYDTWLVRYGTSPYGLVTSGTSNVEIGISARAITLSGLMPGTRYVANVRAKRSSSGQLSPPTAVVFTTAAAAGSSTPPYWTRYPVSSEHITSTSVSLYQPVLTSTSDTQDEYVIAVSRAANSSTSHKLPMETIRNVLRDSRGLITVSDLSPRAKYTVRVRRPGLPQSHWSAPIVVQTLATESPVWPEDALLEHQALPTSGILRLPRSIWYANTSQGAQVRLRRLSDAYGQWPRGHQAFPNVFPLEQFTRNRQYLVLTDLEPASAYAVAVGIPDAAGSDMLWSAELVLATLSTDSPVWPEPPEDYHLSTPTLVSLRLPESHRATSSLAPRRLYEVRYRPVRGDGERGHAWLRWPERFAEGRASAQIALLQSGTRYEFVLCLGENTVWAPACGVPYTSTTGEPAFTTRLEAQVYSVSLGPRSVTLTLPWRLSTDILNRTAYDTWLVRYGTSPYGLVTSGTSNVEIGISAHAITLSGLMPGTRYVANVRAKRSSSGQLSPPTAVVFTTAAAAGSSTPPYWTRYPVSSEHITSTSVSLYQPVLTSTSDTQDEYVIAVSRAANSSTSHKLPMETIRNVLRDSRGLITVSDLSPRAKYTVRVRRPGLPQSHWSAPIVVQTLATESPVWPEDALLEHQALPTSGILRLPRSIWYANTSQGAQVRLRRLSDAYGQWPRGHQAFPNVFPLEQFTRNRQYLVLTDLEPASAYAVAVGIPDAAGSDMLWSAELVLATLSTDSPVWPEPPEDYHLSTPTLVSLRLPESHRATSSLAPRRLYEVRYRPVRGDGERGHAWLRWPERFAEGRASAQIALLQSGTRYEFVLCLGENTVWAPACGVPYTSTTGEPGAPLWSPRPYNPVLSTPSSLVLRTPHLADDGPGAGSDADQFEVFARYAGDVVGEFVVSWSSWQSIAAIQAGRYYQAETTISNLSPGTSGITQLRCRLVRSLRARDSSAVVTNTTAAEKWSLPLHVNLPVLGSPQWPPGAFPIDGVRDDSILVIFPLALPRGATNYKIFFRQQTPLLVWLPWTFILMDDKDLTTIWLRNLSPNTWYEVKLQAVNNTHVSAYSPAVSVRTLATGVPSQPPNPVLLPVNLTQLLTVELPWNYFARRNQEVSCFNVMYRSVLGPGVYAPYWIARGCAGAPRLDLERAEPLSRYQVLLVATNDAGESSPGMPSFAATPDAYPPFRPNVSFAAGHVSTSVGIRLPARPDAPGLHPVHAIAIMYEVAGTGRIHRGPVVQLAGQPATVGIVGLQPDTSYLFFTQAIGAGGLSPLSPKAEIRTLAIGDAVQPQSPTLLHSRRADTILVALPLPRSENPLHQTESYQVSYAPLSAAGGTLVGKYESRMPTAQSGKIWLPLDELKVGTTYGVRLRSITHRGPSEWSMPSTITTLQSDDLPAVRLPRIVQVSSRSAVIDSQALVEHSELFGKPISATVEIVSASELHTGAWRAYTFSSASSRFVRLPNLIPSTHYLTRWRLSSGKQTSPWRRGKPFVTPPLAPGTPQPPRILRESLSPTTVQVVLPGSAAQADTNYTMEVCLLETSSNRCEVSPVIKSVQYPNRGVTWTGLLPGTRYSVALQASNIHGSSSPSRTTFETLREGEPAIPLAPSVGFNVSSYSIPLVLQARHPLAEHKDFVSVSHYRVACQRPGEQQYSVVDGAVASSDGLILDGAYTYDEDGSVLSGQYRFKLQSVSIDGRVSRWSDELLAEPLPQGVPVVPRRPTVLRRNSTRVMIRSDSFFHALPHHGVKYFNISVQHLASGTADIPASSTQTSYLQIPFGRVDVHVDIPRGIEYRVCASAVNHHGSASAFGPCSGQGTAPYVVNKHLIQLVRYATVDQRIALPCPMDGLPAAEKLWYTNSSVVGVVTTSTSSAAGQNGDGQRYLVSIDAGQNGDRQRYLVSVDGTGNKHVAASGDLVIRNARSTDSGTYVCEGSNRHGRASLSLQLIVLNATECVKNGRNVSVGETRRFLSSWSSWPAMDVMFLVGQSQSLSNHYEWLSRLPATMSEWLRNTTADELSLGLLETLDRFSLFAFGASKPNFPFGQWLTMPSARTWGTSREFRSAVCLLKDGHSYQDGFHALRMALQSAELRGDAVCHIVFVADQPRQQLQPPVSGRQLSESVTRSGCSLHVLGDGLDGMLPGERDPAAVLGIMAGQALYRRTGSGRNHFDIVQSDAKPHRPPGYASLALGTASGSVWNLNQPGNADQLAAALASHLTSVTIAQLCERCTCRVSGKMACTTCTNGN